MGIIGSIRKHSWVAVAIVGIAIVAFIIGDLSKNWRGEPDMAAIEGVTLTRTHFEGLVNQEETKIKMFRSHFTGDPNPTLTSMEEKMIRDSVWANYVDEMVLGEELEKLGLEVSEAEMNDMYNGEFIHPQIYQALCDPRQDTTIELARASISRVIKESNRMDTINRLKWDELKRVVLRDRLRQKYVSLVASGFYMPTPIAKQMAEYGSQVANVDVVALRFDQVAESEVKLSDADYQKYYDEHKEEFRNFFDERRALDYVSFPIRPSAKDFAAAQDSANVAWARLKETPDSLSRELARLVKSESIKEFPYDSTYHRASYYPEGVRELVEASDKGAEIVPMQLGSRWYMGRVMGVDHRPDSIRTSVLFILNDNWNQNIKRDTARAEFLADSLLAELNAGRLDFDTAVSDFCDVKLAIDKEHLGDADWREEGTLDAFYNSIFERPGMKLSIFNGLNEKVVKVAEGGYLRFDFPDNLGHAIVKVTGKTEPVKKYRLALIVQEITPSNETVNETQNQAYKFLSDNRNAKSIAEAAQKQNFQWSTAYVQMMDDNLNNLDNARDVVKWAFEDNTKVGDVKGDVVLLDEIYVVVALRDVIQKGYYTLAQLRGDPAFENMVRLNKVGEIQMARAEKLAKSCKNIQDVAVSLNDSVVSIDSVSAFGYNFGGFGAERKVQSMVATSKGNGLLAPIKGTKGVYFVQVTGRGTVAPRDIESYRMESTMGNLRLLASPNRNMPSRHIQGDCMLFQWLRAKANVEDHRNLFY